MIDLTTANWIALVIGIISIIFNVVNFKRVSKMQTRESLLSEFNSRYFEVATSIFSNIQASCKQSKILAKFEPEAKQNEKLLIDFISIKHDIVVFINDIASNRRITHEYTVDYVSDKIDQISEIVDTILKLGNEKKLTSDDQVKLRKCLCNYSILLNEIGDDLKTKIYNARNKI